MRSEAEALSIADTVLISLVFVLVEGIAIDWCEDENGGFCLQGQLSLQKHVHSHWVCFTRMPRLTLDPQKET